MSAQAYPILRLGAADVALMRQLNLMFGEAFGEPETYAVQPPDDDWLRRGLARDSTIALAALDGEAPVGGLVAYELDKFERPRREVYLYDLAVAATHRRRRIATRLIERLREIALYQGLGAREDVIHFDIAVRRRRR